MNILVARRSEQAFDLHDEQAMYRLRYKVFYERLRWDVPTANGEERDQYDDLDPVYMLYKSPQDIVQGCWRLLPTQGPYMLRDTFPQLLHGQAAPSAPDIWEMSRFAIEGSEQSGFGFTATPVAMIRNVLLFARAHGISRYVTVSTVAVERMLTKLGINTTRLGPPLQIGIARAVAFYVEMDEQAERVLLPRCELGGEGIIVRKEARPIYCPSLPRDGAAPVYTPPSHVGAQLCSP
ncbi:acyl-homoserine-lactone synthase [Chitinolyticbacter albus]|uniref:acyl-homoserine-lactone synthase n=1 Tax=Chitinolyticbacter albus TaxID=2961951 RepID=UPI00210960B8|nr:acyl-homoserine-lactone synthase [Chitinolyticbacter albus]